MPAAVPPTPPTQPEIDDEDEHGDAPAYAGVDDEIVEGRPAVEYEPNDDHRCGVDNLDDDERIPTQEEIDALGDELAELEVGVDMAVPGGDTTVTHIHVPAPSDPPPKVLVRWIVPAVPGPAWAHAMLTNATRTMCRGHLVDHAMYPPGDGVPRCPACVEELSRA